MKFFMSSEVQADISDDFQLVQKEVEQKLKFLESRNYGVNVEEIGIIPIVVNLTPELEEAGFFKERVKYSKKNKDSDIRLRINHSAFKNANKEIKKMLLVKNIVQSIRALQLKTTGFDAASLEKDVLELFKINKVDIENLDM
jgi:hypothetical protein